MTTRAGTPPAPQRSPALTPTNGPAVRAPAAPGRIEVAEPIIQIVDDLAQLIPREAARSVLAVETLKQGCASSARALDRSSADTANPGSAG